jgi:uncharacterized membrane-anchored protein
MTSLRRFIPSWRFWLPLCLQVVLVLSLPAQAIYTHLTGQIIVLQVAPVDPYDLLRGYSVTLSYDISRYATLEDLPGWEQLQAPQPDAGSVLPNPDPANANEIDNQIFYIILEAPEEVGGEPPAPWTAVAVSRDRPSDLPPNQVSLQGRERYGMATYGLERYYVPEDQITEVNEQISQLQRNVPMDDPDNLPPIVVEAKVDAQGNAVPLSLWLGDREYRY